MDRQTLLSAIDQGPIRVHMNDGSAFDITSHKDCAVDSLTVYLVYRDEDERYRARWLSLVCMVRIEQIPEAVK